MAREEWPEMPPSVRGNHNDLDPNNNAALRVLLNEERNRSAREFARGVEAMRRAVLAVVMDADDAALAAQIQTIVVS